MERPEDKHGNEKPKPTRFKTPGKAPNNRSSSDEHAEPELKKRKTGVPTPPHAATVQTNFNRWNAIKHERQEAAEEREQAEAAKKGFQSYCYAGPNRTGKGDSEKDFICCNLCNSMFFTRDKLIEHFKESTVHEKNLKNESTVSDAEKRMKNRGIELKSTIGYKKTRSRLPNPKAQLADGYVDRAKLRREEERLLKERLLKERREKEGSEPIKIQGFSLGQKRKSVFPQGEADDVPIKSSKGAMLLGKAGGAAGFTANDAEKATPLIDVIKYAPGAGLGMKGANLGNAVEQAEVGTAGGSQWRNKLETVKQRFYEE